MFATALVQCLFDCLAVLVVFLGYQPMRQFSVCFSYLRCSICRCGIFATAFLQSIRSWLLRCICQILATELVQCPCLLLHVGYRVATISRLLKITGLFCKIQSLYRALLQKRPTICRSLLIVDTPYTIICAAAAAVCSLDQRVDEIRPLTVFSLVQCP